MNVWGATNVSCPIELKWSLNSLNNTVTASSSPVCTLLILGVSPNTTTVHQSHYAKHPLQPCKSKSGAFKISLTALSAATQTLFRCTVQTNFRIHGLASLWNGEFQISLHQITPKKRCLSTKQQFNIMTLIVSSPTDWEVSYRKTTPNSPRLRTCN